ncbi:MAG: hypothetical protein RMI39_05280 [Thermoanaerobaculum sp.]|nr:hypothetical protein [Thermoanaerobaculum sp.]
MWLAVFFLNLAGGFQQIALNHLPATPDKLVAVGHQYWLVSDITPQTQGQPAVWAISPRGELLASATLEQLRARLILDLTATPQGLVALDVYGQLLQLDEKAQVVHRFTLRGNHPFPRYAHSLVYDSQAKLLWVHGCHPTQGYLDLGCLELHAFRGPQWDYVTSQLETPPLAPLANTEKDPARSYKLVRKDARGGLWVVTVADPAGAGWVRPAGSEAWRQLQWGSLLLPFPSYVHDPAELQRRLDEGWLVVGMAFDRQGGCWVAAYQAGSQTTVLTWFSPQGLAQRQRRLPGRFVGSVGEELVLFQAQDKGGVLQLRRLAP